MRPLIDQHTVDQGLRGLALALHKQFMLKGRGAFISSHEALGVITEEYLELVMAVRENNTKHIREELMDLAVAAIFAYICEEEDGV
jgi:hypothetical protein